MAIVKEKIHRTIKRVSGSLREEPTARVVGLWPDELRGVDETPQDGVSIAVEAHFCADGAFKGESFSREVPWRELWQLGYGYHRSVFARGTARKIPPGKF
ncbi:MAG: hypothetical protein HY695_16835 [Deltaproteobacteria bacterium]|nr:hypothetical protein [Deltaproteobacteria bacterium]